MPSAGCMPPSRPCSRSASWRSRVRTKRKDRDVALSVAIGVHLGSGEVVRRSGTSERMVRATGEGLEIARVLEKVGADLRWSIALVTSAGTRTAAGPRVTNGASGSLELPDGTFLEFTEVTGLVPRPGSSTPPAYFEGLRE